MPRASRTAPAAVALALLAQLALLALLASPPLAAAEGRSACRLRFLGAAGMVTGSMHMLERGDRRLLVDCGLRQGLAARNAPRSVPREVVKADAMILTHAHVDHSGNIPLLIKGGFRGKIHCTPATADLCKALLIDSARVQERKAVELNREHRRDPGWRKVEPTYTVRDAERALTQLRPHACGTTFTPMPGVQACFSEAGHILGSASVALDVGIGAGRRRRVVFSGDIGRRGSLMLRPPQAPAGADYVVMESTYGGRRHAPSVDMKAQLLETIRSTQRRGGKVIIPSFALQRTQEIVYLLNQLRRDGQLSIPVYVDSPLGSKLTDVFRRNHQLLGKDARAFARRHGDPFTFPGLTMITSPEESKQLNKLQGSAVIVSSSGMCTAGRVVHHLRHNAADPRNTVAIVGYQAEGTLGRQLVERRQTFDVNGHTVPLRAEVKVLNAFSAHADQGDLLWWAKRCGPQVKKYFLVHGEPAQCAALQRSLAAQGCRAAVPSQGQIVDLD